MKSILTSIAASSLLAALAIAQPAPRYNVRDLGPVGGAPGQPFLITNNGLVIGSAAFPDGTEHAVLWYDVWRGDFGAPSLGGQNSVAFAINAGGQAVGRGRPAAEVGPLDRGELLVDVVGEIERMPDRRPDGHCQDEPGPEAFQGVAEGTSHPRLVPIPNAVGSTRLS